jgi:peroxiredoxin
MNLTARALGFALLSAAVLTFAGCRCPEPAKTPERRKLYAEGIETVRATGVEKSAKQVGDQAPDFELPRVGGGTVRLSDLRRDGPVVLLWYRGGWCPYCNLTLRAYEDRCREFAEAGATLVAISPELPAKGTETVKKSSLSFSVVSDKGNVVASQYGIAFTLPPKIAESYRRFFDIREHNGDDSQKLPLTATYVIDRDGVIRWAFLDADYAKRAEPRDALDAAKRLR